MSLLDLELSLLCHCLHEKRWRNLTWDKFFTQYEEEVGDLDVLVRVVVADLPSYGPCQVYALENGFSILDTGRLSLFETEARFREREHTRRWADFMRGFWSKEPPQEPGLYFVRDREGAQRGVRELVRNNGRLRDISGGMVRPGRVTEWVGDWWLPKIPPLK